MKDGERRHVQARSEGWHLTYWSDARVPGVDAVSVEIEKYEHNFDASLSAEEAGPLIDALLELLPDARLHSRLLSPAPTVQPAEPVGLGEPPQQQPADL